MGAITLLKILSELYNAGLRNSVTPETWNMAIVILKNKKRDAKLWTN